MPTEQALRNAVALRLPKAFGSYVVTDVATGPRAPRWGIVKPLGALGTLRGHDTLSTDLVGAFTHSTSGLDGSIRRVIHQERDIGAVLLDQPLAAALQVGYILEFSMLPAYTSHGIPGIRDFLDLGGDDIKVADRINQTTVAGQDDYPFSLTTYPWFKPERVVMDARGPVVYDPPRATGGVRRRSSRRWEIVMDGASPVLRCLDRPYAVSGFTFQLAVERPGISLLSGSDITAGFSQALQTTVSETHDMVEATLRHIYRWLAGWSELTEQERARYAEMAVTQEARVRQLASYLSRDKPMQEVA